MDELFTKAIFGFVLVALVVMAMALALVGTPMIIGLIGFLLVKTKVPLVSPKGPAFVPVTYAVLWGAALSVGLLLASSALQPYVRDTALTRAALIAENKVLVFDALWFAIDTAVILLTAAFVGSSSLAKGNAMFAAACVCATTALLFSATPFGGQDWFVDQIAARIAEMVLSPLRIAEALTKGWAYCVELLREWILDSHGNAFVLLGGLAKVLWLVSLSQAALGLSGHKPEPTSLAKGGTLDGAEWRRFVWAVTLFIGLAGAVYFAAAGDQPNGSLAVFFLLLYPPWAWVLWQSRPRLQ